MLWKPSFERVITTVTTDLEFSLQLWKPSFERVITTVIVYRTETKVVEALI